MNFKLLVKNDNTRNNRIIIYGPKMINRSLNIIKVLDINIK